MISGLAGIMLLLAIGGIALWQSGLLAPVGDVIDEPVDASTPEEIAAWKAGYTDTFLSDTLRVLVTSTANVRDYPSSTGTIVLRFLPEGAEISGKLVTGRGGDQTWFKLDEGGYIWDGSIQNSMSIESDGSVSVLTGQSMPQASNGSADGWLGNDTYNDAFSYCAAVKTIDEPGPAYRGPRVPEAVARAAGTELVTWRCDKARVLACTIGASGRLCVQKNRSTTPNKALMEFCRRRPNQDPDMATMGNSAWNWQCRGSTPEPVDVNQNSLDSRGYYKDTWEVVPSRGTSFSSIQNPSRSAGASTILSNANWYDGAGGCASIKASRDNRTITLNAWYCEADKTSSSPVMLEFDRTVDNYVDELTGLQLRVVSAQKIRIISTSDIRSRLGDAVYIAEDVRDYIKQ
jgi:hypothetical protein